MKKKFYFKGDLVEATGNEFTKYGETWVEFVFLEGHRKGTTGVTGKNHWTYKCQ